MAVSVVVFLGNPGESYMSTRHNLGWWVGDLVAAQARARYRSGKGDYRAAQAEVGGQQIILVKPTTFMNDSGRALRQLASSHTFDHQSLLVVADDIALPLGRIRVRSAGSSGGHNGLESIISTLGTEQFARIRCGVGPVPPGADAAEFVLDSFNPDELVVARDMTARAAEAVEIVLSRGVSAAADIYNRKPPASDSSPEGVSDAE